MDSRSFVYTLFQLLTRPGYLVRDYISGRRQVSFPPVKMLVIVSLFTFIVESAFHLDNEILTLKTNIPEIDKIIKWFNDNKSWGTLFFQAFYSGVPLRPAISPSHAARRLLRASLSEHPEPPADVYRLLGLICIRKYHFNLLLPHSLPSTLRLQLVGDAVALFRHRPLCPPDDDNSLNRSLLYP